VGNPFETRDRLGVGKDSDFILSMVQGVRQAGDPQPTGAARLARHRDARTVRVLLAVPTLFVIRWSVGAGAEREQSG
jgi:hypothetical protein